MVDFRIMAAGQVWSTCHERVNVFALTLLCIFSDICQTTMSQVTAFEASRLRRTHNLLFTTLDMNRASLVTDVEGVKSFKPGAYQYPSESNRFHDCCQHMCRCNATFANCSRHPGNLTYIPVLPEGIKYLDFSHNGLAGFVADDFFSNVTNLTGINLSHNYIVSLSGDAFLNLTTLRHLDLSYNNLNSTGFAKLVVTSRRRFGFHLNDSDNQHPLAKLISLRLENNHIENVNFTALKILENLYYLELKNNKIRQITPDLMPTITVLGLNNNRIFEFPESCKNKTSLMPNLRDLYLFRNSISDISGIEVCLPGLRFLDLECNRLDEFFPYTISAARFPQLRNLFLASVSVRGKFHPHAFSHPLLETLDVSFNGLNFTNDSSVHPDAFVGCNGLLSLNLEDNVFTNIRDEKLNSLLGQLPSLKLLYIGYIEIYKITKNTFRNLMHVEALYLYGNALTDIPDGVFDHMSNLTSIELYKNEISTISESTFSMSLRQQLKHLDLSANAFECNCDLMWFRQWFASDLALFNKSSASYECVNVPNTDVASFYLSEQACLFSRDFYTFTVVCVAVLLFALILLTSLYRYRWQLRLIVYEAFRGPANRRQLRLQTGTFKYDLFVSYAQGDLHWVCEHLIPELEIRRGLRLCVHQRDFLPGDYIVDNISDNVDVSKKVMFIFSRNFTRSQWCQFELKLCLGHVLEQDDQLVVVCLHELQSRDLTSTMLAVLKTTTYIGWGDEPEARASFWGRLALALKDVTPAHV